MEGRTISAMSKKADFKSWVAEFAWLSVATRRSAELASTRSVNELAHSTSDLPISATAGAFVAKGRPFVVQSRS